MIDFSKKTYENILNAQLERISDSYDKRDGSFLQTALGPASWHLEGVYMDLAQLQQNSNIETAVADSLDSKCKERGIIRKKATHAVKLGKFNVSLPIGTRFSIMGGDLLSYTVSEMYGELNGTYEYLLTCDTPGQIGNGYVGTLLMLDYVENLQIAEMTTLISAGVDEESDDSLRARYFASFAIPEFGGNIASYRSKILDIEGVGGVQVYPAWSGGGTVLCSIINANMRAADIVLISKVQEIICPLIDGVPSPNGLGMAPIGAAVTIVSATEVEISISCTIMFQTSVLNGAEVYRNEIEAKISKYISEVRSTWGNALKSKQIKYPVCIYIARIVQAIMAIPEVINVSDILINGENTDFLCVETAQLQQLPVLGEVHINAS